MEVSCFARNIYIYICETESVTSWLCYVEDLIFLENNKVWFWNWVHFIYRLFILFISRFSFSLILYTVSWAYKGDYLNMSIDILFYIMFYIITMMKKHYTLLYCLRTYDPRKVPIWTWPSQFTICNYARDLC